jgi:thiamine pyrophosphokinase
MTTGRQALLLCNGSLPGRRLVRTHAAASDLIIAADGGANAALASGVTPDVIIGDLDSISPTARQRFHRSSIIQVRRQDNTDLEKALDYLRTVRMKKVTILGATGKRIDFTLGNLAVLWNYTRFLDITVAGDGWYARPVGRRLALSVRKGTTVSLIPFGHCSGITLNGFRYPLRNGRMRVGQIGVSNVAERSRCTVSVRRGKMLVIVLTGAGRGSSW